MFYSLDLDQTTENTPCAVAEPTDEQLMERVKCGDEHALECLRQRHKGLMRTVISGVMNNDDEIDDIMQECLLQVWQRANTYDCTRGKAIGWLVTMVRRRAIDRLRRRTTYLHARDRMREESATVRENHFLASDEQAEQSDRAEAVGRLIDRLPHAQQEVVRLTFYHGLSQRQVAAHTGIPLGTIKTRLELAMRKLRSAALAFGELHDGPGIGRAKIVPFPTPTASCPAAA